MSKKMDLDYILEDVVGGGGRWQWRKWLFLVPTYLAMGAPALLMQMFSAYTPAHRSGVMKTEYLQGGGAKRAKSVAKLNK